MSKDLTPEQRALLALHDRLAALEAEVRVLRRRDTTAVLRPFTPPRVMGGALLGVPTQST